MANKTKIWLKCPLIVLMFTKLCCPVIFDNPSLNVKQMYVFKLLNHVTEPCIYEEIKNISNNFQIHNNLDLFTKTEQVKEFAKSFKEEQLPRGEIFCLFCDKQLQQAIKTFLILYYANDFSTFLKMSSWLRQNVNEGLFVYAFYVALRHRDDCRNIIVPPIFEIYPFLFIDQRTVQNSAIVKMNMNDLDDELRVSNGIKKIDTETIEITDTSDLFISEEDKLSYFTRDIGLNTYYYNFHIDYPFWMGDDIFGLTIDRRGELYIYMHRQLIARYNLERLSNRLYETDAFDPEAQIETGIRPSKTFHTGWSLPMRPNNAVIGRDKSKVLKEIHNFEHRLRDAIMNGFIVSHDGAKMDMRRVEGVEVIGRRIYGNLDKSDRDLLYFYDVMTRDLLSPKVHFDGVQAPTSCLQYYEMALHDPVFWTLQKSTLELVDKFDVTRSAHRREDLFFAGVKISSVAVGKLVTYFEEHSIDITNAVPLNAIEVNNNSELLKLYASITRLNHVGFEIVIHVESDKTISSVIRLFLGPKVGFNGKSVNVADHRHNFIELDTFIQTLNVGNNSISRHSSEFNNIVDDREMTRDLWKFFESNKEINISSHLHGHTGFPTNLILPKGSRGGRPLMLFAIISPLLTPRTYSGFNIEEVRAKKRCRFNLCIHTVPLGFPFDKKVDMETLILPNSRFVDVIVFHKSKKEVAEDLRVIPPFL